MTRITAVVLVMLFFSGCSSSQTDSPVKYTKLVFERLGGGNLVFDVTPADDPDYLNVNVSRKNFRDTTITLKIYREDETASVFKIYSETLSGLRQVVGGYKEGTIPKGTWVHFYLVRGVERIEITNPDLRDSFITFENLVRARL